MNKKTLSYWSVFALSIASFVALLLITFFAAVLIMHLAGSDYFKETSYAGERWYYFDGSRPEIGGYSLTSYIKNTNVSQLHNFIYMLSASTGAFAISCLSGILIGRLNKDLKSEFKVYLFFFYPVLWVVVIVRLITVKQTEKRNLNNLKKVSFTTEFDKRATLEKELIEGLVSPDEFEQRMKQLKNNINKN